VRLGVEFVQQLNDALAVDALPEGLCKNGDIAGIDMERFTGFG
jgi:hypothetical protein